MQRPSAEIPCLVGRGEAAPHQTRTWVGACYLRISAATQAGGRTHGTTMRKGHVETVLHIKVSVQTRDSWEGCPRSQAGILPAVVHA